MKPGEARNLLWSAVESAYGIEVETNSVELLKQRLYQTRAKEKERGNDSFDSLQIITPPVDGDTKLWIVRKHGD